MNKKITPHAQKLYDALMKRNISCELEVYDGHKHIDISIPWAKIDIEVDGLQHYINPKQIKSDFSRSYYSIEQDDYDTFHVPNIIIDTHLEEVADAIAIVARSNYKDIKEEEKSWFYNILTKLFGK